LERSGGAVDVYVFANFSVIDIVWLPPSVVLVWDDSEMVFFDEGIEMKINTQQFKRGRGQKTGSKQHPIAVAAG